MPVHNLHRGLPIRLFHRTPGGKAGTSSGLQHAAQFRQCAWGIAEKHHPKAAGGEIKALVGKRQLVRVGQLGREVREFLVPGAPGSNVEQVRTLIHRRDRTLGTNALRQTDPRFAGAAGQIENEHVRERTRVFNDSFCDRVAQRRRFCFPLFCGHQAERGAPRGWIRSGHFRPSSYASSSAPGKRF